MVGLTTRVEIGAALAPTHGQSGQAVLEGLLERKELQHALSDTGVEANAALVGADRVVVLYPPTTLHADVALVVLPTDPKADDAIRLGHAAQNLVLMVLLLVADELEHVLRDLLH